jgi:hypothetical protein
VDFPSISSLHNEPDVHSLARVQVSTDHIEIRLDIVPNDKELFQYARCQEQNVGLWHIANGDIIHVLVLLGIHPDCVRQMVEFDSERKRGCDVVEDHDIGRSSIVQSQSA